MQKKAKQYSAEEKTKVVLEVIKGELSRNRNIEGDNISIISYDENNSHL